MVEPLSEESGIFMMRGIGWNILVKSMRILGFWPWKNRGLDANSFWLADTLAGPGAWERIYAEYWKRSLVSDALLPCRSAENTVWSKWFFGWIESYWSMRTRSCGLWSPREKSEVHTPCACRILTRVAVLFSRFWRYWVWSSQLFLWIVLLHQRALC